MAFDLKKKKATPVALVIEYDGETINLEYDSEKVTQQSLESPGSEAEFVADAILKWDVVSEGRAVEPSLETLKAAGLTFSVFLCAAIVADAKKSAYQKLKT